MWFYDRLEYFENKLKGFICQQSRLFANHYGVDPVGNLVSAKTLIFMYYFTYVLRSKRDGRLYTGYTHQLRKRLAEHNHGLSKSTKGGGPFELIYFEGCLSEKEALKREEQLKSGHGKRYLKNRLGASYF